MARRRLEEFDLGHVLGVGTVGTIYEAWDTRNELRVALKILLPTVSRDALIQSRFAREMVILEKLSHRHIVKYYGGGRSGEQLFFAMELLTGGSLKDELQRGGPLSWVEAATCGAQISSALQYAHNHGIIHRDLKPSNLLFDNSGNRAASDFLKLVDFGIARDTHEADITSKGLTVGSHSYMSPEQINGEASITGKTDLYSLGVVLFEVLAGRPPFVGENFARLFQQHLTEPPPPVAGFAPLTPPRLERLVLDLLAKKPEDRPFSARSVQRALLEMIGAELGGETSEDVPAALAIDLGRQVLIRRLQERRRHVSWLTLGGLVMAVAAAVWMAWFWGNF